MVRWFKEAFPFALQGEKGRLQGKRLQQIISRIYLVCIIISLILHIITKILTSEKMWGTDKAQNDNTPMQPRDRIPHTTVPTDVLSLVNFLLLTRMGRLVFNHKFGHYEHLQSLLLNH